MRWHRSEHGPKTGAFHYPRGISLGFIQKEEKLVECLAVCDSWNHRVQFLDNAGNPIVVWKKGGDKPLLEPSDVRFIPAFSNSGHGTDYRGYWLVLERENHSLSAIGPDGRFLFQIGRGFPKALQDRWAIPGMLFEKDSLHPGFIREFPLFDFCFYPSRILGSSERSLYIWEPRSRELKQVLLSNFLPVLSSSENIEWISADNSGLIGWKQDMHCLYIYSIDGQYRREAEVSGIPIPSNLPLKEIWLQKGDCIERNQWYGINPDPDPARSMPQYPLLFTMAETELACCSENLIRETVAAWAEVVDEELALTARLASQDKNIDSRQWTRILEEIRSLSDRRSKAEQSFMHSIHHWSLGLLEWHFSVEDAVVRAGKISTEQDKWIKLSLPIRDKFTRCQDGLDSLFLLRVMLSREPPNENMLEAVSVLEEELQKIREWIYKWIGVREAVTGYLPISWTQPLANMFPLKEKTPGYRSPQGSR